MDSAFESGIKPSNTAVSEDVVAVLMVNDFMSRRASGFRLGQVWMQTNDSCAVVAESADGA